jgi:hypothetical protein
MPDHHSFLTASAMIARQALADVDNDPARAAGRWLDLAREPWFRDGVLVSYIAVIAASRSGDEGHDQSSAATQRADVDPSSSAAAGHDQGWGVTQAEIVDPAADYSAGERHDHQGCATQRGNVDRPSADPAAAHDHSSNATQRTHVDAATGPSHSVDERHDQARPASQAMYVDRPETGAGGGSQPASPIREPSTARRQASRRVRRQEMLDNVIYMFERNGARTPLKDIPLKRLPNLVRFYGRQAWAGGLQHNLSLALLTKAKLMVASGQAQPEMLIGQVFNDDELISEVTAAKITTSGSQIILPVDIERTQRGLWPGLPTPAA